VRVVSLPSWDLFEAQPEDYRRSVLPRDVRRRLAIEAASPFGWERYVGDGGRVHGLARFGASAPLKDLARHFGFTAEAVAAEAERLLSGGPGGYGRRKRSSPRLALARIASTRRCLMR
jgi:transketolase